MSEGRAAELPRDDLLDMRRAGVDVRINKDDVLRSRDLFGKLRHELLGAKKCGAHNGFEQIQDAIRHTVVSSQGIANSDAQSPHR